MGGVDIRERARVARTASAGSIKLVLRAGRYAASNVDTRPTREPAAAIEAEITGGGGRIGSTISLIVLSMLESASCESCWANSRPSAIPRTAISSASAQNRRTSIRLVAPSERITPASRRRCVTLTLTAL
jgi:hypothetical protein